MRTYIRSVSFLVLLIIIGIILSSCKKGDGDPFLSLRSRKARITGEWWVSSLTSTYSYTNKKYETSYDGVNKKVVYTVKDTLINGVTTNYSSTQAFAGQTHIDLKKDGSYFYNETFQDVSTGQTVRIEINGLWYFMGGNKQNDFKNKELLALQVTDYVYHPYSGSDHTTLYQGNNTLDVYEIYQLKNDEVILKVNKTETIDFIKYTTTMEYTLTPR